MRVRNQVLYVSIEMATPYIYHNETILTGYLITGTGI